MRIKLPPPMSGSLNSNQHHQSTGTSRRHIHYHGLWPHVNTNSTYGQQKCSAWDHVNSKVGDDAGNPQCKLSVVLRP